MQIWEAALTPGNELKGKVALVTGATRNIGRSIALSLAAGGAAVAVNARDSQARGDAVVKDIEAMGGQAKAFVADVTDPAAVQAMVDGVIKRFGRLDIVVLNAAVRNKVSFTKMSFDEWRRIMSISLDGSFHVVKAAVPHMIQAGGGAIVALGGMVSLSGAKERVHGSVVKHGLVGMMRALAVDLAEHGIRANLVAPGTMNTSKTYEAVKMRPAPDDKSPIGRMGEPEEVAAAVRFLCGPMASFINGQTLHVNGGKMRL